MIGRCRALTVALSLLLPLSVRAGAAPAVIERQLGLMATELRLRVEAADRPAALAASEAAVRALEAAEARLSTWSAGSELSRVNAAPVGSRVALSPALASDLGHARRCSELTDGAFDAAVGALVDAWGLRSGGRIPTRRERSRAVRAGGLGAWRLESGSATRKLRGLRIEEGGFGKGAGLDDALAVLAAAPGMLRAQLDLGGQVAVLGGPATVAIAHPDLRDRVVAEIVLDQGSLSTSGNSEHGIEVAGRRLGHLLDPRTGWPATDFGSVVVWARSALAADCLSTGLFVMGPRRALRWARAHPEFEVLMLRREGARVVAEATAGLRGKLRMVDPAVQVRFQGISPPSPTGDSLTPARSSQETSPPYPLSLTGEGGSQHTCATVVRPPSPVRERG